jgi:hypothetical protein
MSIRDLKAKWQKAGHLCENVKLFRSNAIPKLIRPLVSVLPLPLSFIKRAVSGPNATAFYPSIPNGGFD